MNVQLMIGDTPNYATVTVGDLDLYFSYRTVIGFRYQGERLIRRNDWGPTTGKHLNRLDGGDKSSRVSGEAFEARLTEILATLSLTRQEN